MDIRDSDFFDEITRIGNRAVHKAQEENRRLGIPNVYCVGGTIIYQMPSGEIRTEEPIELKLDDTIMNK